MVTSEDVVEIVAPLESVASGVGDISENLSRSVDGDPSVAAALSQVARALVLLGNADAVSPTGIAMGAIENLSIELRHASQRIAGAISELAQAVTSTKK